MTGIGIIGANVAGVGVARGLRDEGYSGSITLIDRDAEAMIDRPSLSKSSLIAGTSAPTIIGPAHLDQLGVEFRVADVSAIDPAITGIRLTNGEAIACEAIALCTGASPVRPAWLAALGPDHCLTLRTAADARILRSALGRANHAVVIGGGLVGMEVAAVARTLGVAITVVETQPAPMIRAFGEACGRHVAKIHADHGVELKLGTAVRSVEATASGILVALDNGDRLRTDLVIAALGAAPCTALADAAGIATDDGILVDAFGRTSVPRIFAAGDVARFPQRGAMNRAENVQHGFLHGHSVGRAIAGHPAPYGETQIYSSGQFDHMIQACGIVEGTPALVQTDERVFKAFWHDEIALTGFVGVDAGRDGAAARRLIDRGLPIDINALAGGLSLHALARART